MEIQNKENSPIKGLRQLKLRWPEMTQYDRFEYLVMLFVSFILMVIILVALFQLVENVYHLVIAQITHKPGFRAFQATFGMLLTLLITIEFRNSINAVLEGKGLLVQVKIVVLIAILAFARKFVVFEPEDHGAVMVVALASVALSLGIIYWLLDKRDRDNNS